MGWEKRERGGLYYYRKKRVGGRVVSEYAGGGSLAQLFAVLDGSDRAEREERRAKTAARRESDRRADAGLDELRAACDLLTTAALLAGGCHAHKGEWRRRRDARRTDHRGAE